MTQYLPPTFRQALGSQVSLPVVPESTYSCGCSTKHLLRLLQSQSGGAVPCPGCLLLPDSLIRCSGVAVFFLFSSHRGHFCPFCPKAPPPQSCGWYGPAEKADDAEGLTVPRERVPNFKQESTLGRNCWVPPPSGSLGRESAKEV